MLKFLILSLGGILSGCAGDGIWTPSSSPWYQIDSAELLSKNPKRGAITVRLDTELIGSYDVTLQVIYFPNHGDKRCYGTSSGLLQTIPKAYRAVDEYEIPRGVSSRVVNLDEYLPGACNLAVHTLTFNVVDRTTNSPTLTWARTQNLGVKSGESKSLPKQSITCVKRPAQLRDSSYAMHCANIDGPSGGSSYLIDPGVGVLTYEFK